MIPRRGTRKSANARAPRLGVQGTLTELACLRRFADEPGSKVVQAGEPLRNGQHLGRRGQSLFAVVGSASRLEQLDGISVRILDLDLATTGTGFHLVAKTKSRFLQVSDEA